MEELFMEQNEALWKTRVFPILKSKVEELHLLGYDRATEDEVWKCILKKRRKKKEETQLHELINDILSLPPSAYMNWLTAESLKVDDYMSTFKDLEIEN
jgi:hypothetical protein